MGKVSGIAGMLLLVATLAAPVPAAKADGTGKNGEASAAISAVLDAQVAAWNRGDLKGYMQGYWHSTELTFFAGQNESAGWEAAYRRYRTAYTGKDKDMGKLKYSNLRVEVLGPDAAFVRGGWQLTMKDGSQRKGLFTVVFKKFSEGWRIIHDHSS
jgi:uncharacterized protein (TIGR02246 family)